MLNTKPNMSSTLPYNTNIEGCYDIKAGNDNNTDNKDFKPKEKYVKILVEDPYNNRDIILQVTKKQKGVYV